MAPLAAVEAVPQVQEGTKVMKMTEKEAKETPSEAADVTLEVAVLSLPYYPPPYYNKGKNYFAKSAIHHHLRLF